MSDKAAEARRTLQESNRHEGDWNVWSDGPKTIVGWMPWRQDAGPVVLIEAANARDGHIIAGVLTATEARLPEGFVFVRGEL